QVCERRQSRPFTPDGDRRPVQCVQRPSRSCRQHPLLGNERRRLADTANDTGRTSHQVQHSIELLKGTDSSMTRTFRTAAVTRRDVLRVLGIGAGAGLIPVLSDHRSADAGLLQAPPPRTTSIPRGAVIRTILRDLSPNALGNGAILFHEHLSFGGSFFERMRPANAPRPATPPAPSYLEN